MSNEHIVAGFDQDLAKIKAQVLSMGEAVNQQIQKATEALANFDAEAVDLLITTDRRINGMHKNIHSRAESLIARRQPMALDLRQALAPVNIAGELERIGDHAKSTAKRSRKLVDGPSGAAAMEIIAEMSTLTQSMLRQVLSAYYNVDIDLAAEIRDRDQKVDKLNKALFKLALDAIAAAPDKAEAFIHTILLARTFERVGDHVVNIARHVHQIATGEDLKASE